MKNWYFKDELRVFKRMLYAFSFTTLSCVLCGIDALGGSMSLTFNMLIAILSEILMISWIFLSFPSPTSRRSMTTINAVARICTTIGLIFLFFAWISHAHVLRGFVFLASLPYIIVGGTAWAILFLKRKQES